MLMKDNSGGHEGNGPVNVLRLYIDIGQSNYIQGSLYIGIVFLLMLFFFMGYSKFDFLSRAKLIDCERDYFCHKNKIKTRIKATERTREKLDGNCV